MKKDKDKRKLRGPLPQYSPELAKAYRDLIRTAEWIHQNRRE